MAILNRISGFSYRSLEKISEPNLQNIRGLIAEYVDFLINNFRLEEAKNILDQQQGNIQGNILHIAAKFGDVFQIKRILEFIDSDAFSYEFGKASDARNSRYYVNLRDSAFLSPLHHAAKNGWVEALSLLIHYGAETNPKSSANDREWLPIHYAAKAGHLEIVKTLIASRADKEAKTAFGLTPLMIAAEFGRLEILQYLLEIGANKNAKTIAENYCMNALHYAAIDGYNDVAVALIRAGVNIEEKTLSGLTPLHFAVGAGNADTVNILLQNGADIDVKTNMNHDLLYLAAAKGKTESVRMLLKWGVGNLKQAARIARKNSNNEIANEINLYRKAIIKLFSMRNLPQNLSAMIRSFSRETIYQDKIILEKNVTFNARGIMNLRYRVGISRKKMTLSQAAHRKHNEKLFDDLAVLEKVIGLYKTVKH